jgi:hypothetical protein
MSFGENSRYIVADSINQVAWVHADSHINASVDLALSTLCIQQIKGISIVAERRNKQHQTPND